MKNLTYFTILLFFLQMSCSKNNDSETTPYPECIKTEIKEISKKPVQVPRGNIKKYTYLGKTVYEANETLGIDAGGSIVYDENCNIICRSTVTIEGSSTTCVDWNKAIFIETVWTDSR